MGRLLVLFFIVVGAIWLVKRALRDPGEDASPARRQRASDLVPCARCGVNLPREEAREAGGALFCSDEHARLGRA